MVTVRVPILTYRDCLLLDVCLERRTTCTSGGEEMTIVPGIHRYPQLESMYGIVYAGG